jgi:cell division GTPase FtsZ
MKNNSSIKKTHFVGIGQAGKNALIQINNNNEPGIYSYIDGIPQLLTLPDIHLYQFSYTDFNQNREHFDTGNYELPDYIINIFNKENRYVICVGLGGITGTHLVKKLYLRLKEKQIEFVVIASFPFSFEGKKRKIMAESAVRLFETNCFYCFRLDELPVKDFTSLWDAYNYADTMFYNIYKKLKLSSITSRNCSISGSPL